MRALITGGAGHVGRTLAALLRARGHDVVPLDRALPAGEGVIADVGDTGALAAALGGQKFDCVFHLAGLGAGAPGDEMARVNIEGTRAMLMVAEAARVVLMSSSAVYGACRDDPIVEDCMLDPASPYGASKLAAEELGRTAHAQGQWVVIARPFNIVGPGQRAPMLQTAALTQLVAIERGLSPPLLKMGYLGNSRDFIDVRDVAAGLLALMGNGASGQAYNLCSGQATKARALVEMLMALSEKDITIQDDARKPGSQDVAYQRGSYQKLERAANWAPCIALAQSLADSLAWQRAQA